MMLFPGNYVIIGGTASDMILGSAGLTAHATKEIDVLLVSTSRKCARLFNKVNSGFLTKLFCRFTSNFGKSNFNENDKRKKMGSCNRR